LEDLSISISENSADEILEEILNDVEDHTKGAEQSDDITCLILKIK